MLLSTLENELYEVSNINKSSASNHYKNTVHATQVCNKVKLEYLQLKNV